MTKKASIFTITISMILVASLLFGSVAGTSEVINKIGDSIKLECINDVPRAYADEPVKKKKTQKKKKKKIQKISKCSKISGRYFKRAGVIKKKGKRYTWYSSRVLRHHLTKKWYVDKEGFYHTKKGYLVCASRDYKRGRIINTPFGKAQVLDYCPVRNVVDMYVNF